MAKSCQHWLYNTQLIRDLPISARFIFCMRDISYKSSSSMRCNPTSLSILSRTSSTNRGNAPSVCISSKVDSLFRPSNSRRAAAKWRTSASSSYISFSIQCTICWGPIHLPAAEHRELVGGHSLDVSETAAIPATCNCTSRYHTPIARNPLLVISRALLTTCSKPRHTLVLRRIGKVGSQGVVDVANGETLDIRGAFEAYGHRMERLERHNLDTAAARTFTDDLTLPELFLVLQLIRGLRFHPSTGGERLQRQHLKARLPSMHAGVASGCANEQCARELMCQ